jgi:hypothetical protein
VAGDGLRRVRKEHGADAVAVYQGNPAAHNLGLLTVGQIVLRSLGTKNLYSASSSDQVPQMLAAELMFGNPVLMPCQISSAPATCSSSARTRSSRTAA